MRLPMRLGDCVRMLPVLIDTGAQANLVRTGLFPHHEWEPAAKPMCLTTVNAGAIAGGMLSGKIEMCFLATGQSATTREAQFYEADIHCDAILGFTFLFKERWLVDAKRQCLVERGPNQLLTELRGLQYEGPDCLSPDATQSYNDSCTVGVSRIQVDSSDWGH